MEKFNINQIEKKYYIFGAGKYGKALFHFLKNYKVNICGFLQNKVGAGDLCEGIPIYELREIACRLTESYVFLAIADENVKSFAKSALIVRGVEESNILDFSRFIEDNCLKEQMINTKKHFCISCGNSVKEFLSMGVEADIFKTHNIVGGGVRNNALCPICGCIDRHRWCIYVLEHYTEIINKPCSVLHFAPEEGITRFINLNRECRYYSADLNPSQAMIQINITDIIFQDSTFDYIIVNHVMEHISDEEIAIRELKRVLKDDGLIIMSFPVCMDQDTFEDSSVVTEKDRLLKFGQEDHVRLYGRDYKDRLESYGLSVEVKTPQQEFAYSDIEKYGFIANDILLLCRIKEPGGNVL